MTVILPLRSIESSETDRTLPENRLVNTETDPEKSKCKQEDLKIDKKKNEEYTSSPVNNEKYINNWRVVRKRKQTNRIKLHESVIWIEVYLRRVWSWLRMNAGGVLNTCKSNVRIAIFESGKRVSNTWEPASKWGITIGNGR